MLPMQEKCGQPRGPGGSGTEKKGRVRDPSSGAQREREREGEEKEKRGGEKGGEESLHSRNVQAENGLVI